MGLWAVVPVKPLNQGKSRLSKTITPEDRRQLNLWLYLQTLRVLCETKEIDEVWIVSQDPEVLAMAKIWGARSFEEIGRMDLNAALEQVTRYAEERGVDQLLILPVDLPCLQKDDVSFFIRKAGKNAGVVIAPDRRLTGTNALMVNPPGCMVYQFGDDSFALHCQQARNKEMPLKICDLPSLKFDLDLPEDYLEYKNMFAVPIGQECSEPLAQMV